MTDFTVKEVIEFSQTIEEESYRFYKESQEAVGSPELKKLTGELAESEMDHLNRLRQLLDETKLSEADLAQEWPEGEEDASEDELDE